MKTVMKNVLLGSVAGLAMVGTAAAADLPVKAKAAEYVKICSTYGAGFYYIPGTDTCLKVGGYVRADFYVTEDNYKFRVSDGDEAIDFSSADGTQSYFKSRGAIQLDARTQTEWGTLRSYFEGRFDYGTNVGLADDGNGVLVDSFSDPVTTDRAYLKYGYIQFAGFTFGKATSFFDFYAGDFIEGIDPGGFYSDVTTNLMGYTADFGNGFSASISIEDNYNRQGEWADILLGAEGGAFYDFDYYDAQQEWPDVVANLTYEGTWGAVKIAGALHDTSGSTTLDPFFGPTEYYSNDDLGWAVLAGVRFDFAETTTLYVEGAYSQGAMGYIGIASFVPDTDAFGDSVDGWYVAAALRHYWTPTVFTSLYGSYAATDNFAIVNDTFDDDFTADFTGWNAGVNLGWEPVKGLKFVLQYDYTNAEYSVSDDWAGSDLHFDAEQEQNRFTFAVTRSF